MSEAGGDDSSSPEEDAFTAIIILLPLPVHLFLVYGLDAIPTETRDRNIYNPLGAAIPHPSPHEAVPYCLFCP
jgi:hypothetical protein